MALASTSSHKDSPGACITTIVTGHNIGVAFVCRAQKMGSAPLIQAERGRGYRKRGRFSWGATLVPGRDEHLDWRRWRLNTSSHLFWLSSTTFEDVAGCYCCLYHLLLRHPHSIHTNSSHKSMDKRNNTCAFSARAREHFESMAISFLFHSEHKGLVRTQARNR